MEPITLDQLDVFRSVAEQGSFSAAARHLGRAQSAISYQIANLERLLGLLLFDRQRRRPVLTAEGRALLADARSVSRDVGQLLARARSLAEGIEGEVSLAVDVMFPMRRVLEALDAFAETYPATAIRLHTEALGAVLQLVADGSCGLGIGPVFDGRPLPEGVERRALDAVELVTVVAADHPLAVLPAPVPERALQAYTQLVLTDRTRVTAGLDLGVVGARTWRLADLGTKHACLVAGFGWGNMPLHQVADELAAGTLRRLHIAALPEPILHPEFFLWRRAQPPGPASRWLLERLLLEAADQSPA